jgi:hypothetical protein
MYTKPPQTGVVFRFGGIFEIFNVRGVTHRGGINTAPMDHPFFFPTFTLKSSIPPFTVK